MKIKLDEDLTASLVPVLKKLGHDVQTTIERTDNLTVTSGTRLGWKNDF
jgi:hypothetical protein